MVTYGTERKLQSITWENFMRRGTLAFGFNGNNKDNGFVSQGQRVFRIRELELWLVVLQ